MAKAIWEVQQKASVIPFPVVKCACKRPTCGHINLNEHAYIYSRVTGEYYADMACMSYTLGFDFDLMDTRLRKRFMEEYEADSIG